MAEADAPEGWRVPQRIAFVAALLVPLTLLVVIVAAGWVYGHYLRPKRQQPMTTFPAPGIETYIHDGHGDPARPPPQVQTDTAIAAAKRETARGPADWGRRP